MSAAITITSLIILYICSAVAVQSAGARDVSFLVGANITIFRSSVFTDEDTEAYLSVSVLQSPFFAPKIPVFETPALPSLYLASSHSLKAPLLQEACSDSQLPCISPCPL